MSSTCDSNSQNKRVHHSDVHASCEPILRDSGAWRMLKSAIHQMHYTYLLGLRKLMAVLTIFVLPSTAVLRSYEESPVEYAPFPQGKVTLAPLDVTVTGVSGHSSRGANFRVHSTSVSSPVTKTCDAFSLSEA